MQAYDVATVEKRRLRQRLGGMILLALLAVGCSESSGAGAGGVKALPIAERIGKGWPLESRTGEIGYITEDPEGVFLVASENTTRCFKGEARTKQLADWRSYGWKRLHAPRPEPCVQDPFGQWWALMKSSTGVSAVQYLASRGGPYWKAPQGKAALPAGAWEDIEVDAFGYIWVLGEGALQRLDPRHPDGGWASNEAFELVNVQAIGRAPSGNLLAALENGRFYEVDIDVTGRWHSRELDIELPEEVKVLGLYTDSRNTLWIFTPETLFKVTAASTWKKGAPLPYGNQAFALVPWKNEVLMLGGLSDCGYPAALEMHQTCFRYNAFAQRWEWHSNLPEPRAFPGAAVLGSAIWLCGGYAPGEGDKKLPSDAVFIYDPKKGDWEPGPALDKPRAEPVVLSVEDRLYCIGGMGPEGPTAEMVSIGIGETEWRQEPPAPISMRQAAGCVIDYTLYCCPGSEDLTQQSPGVYCYDTGLCAWRAGALLAQPAAHAPQVCALDGVLYLFGGWGTKTPLACYAYYPAEDRWAEQPPLPLPLAWGGAAVVQNTLALIGGAFFDPAHKGMIYSNQLYLRQEDAAESSRR